MLTSKGYYIPKYLYRRKIELIRRKIIKRKYGYLFYRKTLSEILPSQAQKYFENCLKKKYLKKWVLFWYEEAIEWKLLLRAEIHYKLSLQQCFLKRWKYFHIQQKTCRIKEKIAEIHYRKNYTRQLKLFCVCKWKLYINYKRGKKRKLRFAWNFYKSKCKPQALLPVFKRWTVFTKAAKRNKLKLKQATKFFENKLAVRVLMKLLTFAKERKVRKQITAYAADLYKKKLLQSSVGTWSLYVKERQRKKQNVVLAETHYSFRLKLNYFRRILRNKNRNQLMRYNLILLKKKQHQRIVTCCFKNLKIYVQYRQCKTQKTIRAVQHYQDRLMKNVMCGWRKYFKYRVEKRIAEQHLLEKVTKSLDIFLLRKCFGEWTQFMLCKRRKIQKKSVAADFYRKCVLRYPFKTWVSLICYKKARRKKKIEAINFHNNWVKNASLSAWKNYVKEENDFKKKLLEAKNYYKHKVINEGLLVIIEGGLEKKEERLKKSRDEIHHQLFLAQKYVSIWKQNVFYKELGKEMMTEKSEDEEQLDEDKENIPRISNFGWYQICFLTPRLPNSYLERLSNS